MNHGERLALAGVVTAAVIPFVVATGPKSRPRWWAVLDLVILTFAGTGLPLFYLALFAEEDGVLTIVGLALLVAVLPLWAGPRAAVIAAEVFGVTRERALEVGRVIVFVLWLALAAGQFWLPTWAFAVFFGTQTAHFLRESYVIERCLREEEKENPDALGDLGVLLVTRSILLVSTVMAMSLVAADLPQSLGWQLALAGLTAALFVSALLFLRAGRGFMRLAEQRARDSE